MKNDLYSHVFGFRGISSNNIVAATQYAMRYAVIAGVLFSLIILTIGLVATHYFGLDDNKIAFSLLVTIAVAFWPMSKVIIFFARRSVGAGRRGAADK